MQSVIVQRPAELQISLVQAASIAALMQKFYSDPQIEAEYQQWLSKQESGEVV